jgi:hypothetical protein
MSNYLIGKINRSGILYIRRGNGIKNQCCCYILNSKCGDHCPLFGEPVYHSENVKLKICQTTLIFKNFADE